MHAPDPYPESPPATQRSIRRSPWRGCLYLGAALAAPLLLVAALAWRPAREAPPAGRTGPAASPRRQGEADAAPPAVEVIDAVTGAAPLPLPSAEDAPPPPTPVPAAAAPAMAAPAGAAADDLVVERRLQRGEEELRRQLQAVPELRLLSEAEIAEIRRATAASTSLATPAVEGQKPARRPFRPAPPSTYPLLVALQAGLHRAAPRAGLAVGPAPRFRLVPGTAIVVQTLSNELRDMGFVSVPGPVPGLRTGRGTPAEKLAAFEKWCDRKQVEKLSGGLTTLVQMLQVEDTPTRLLLVRELSRCQTPESTTALAERAVLDLAPEVRRAAVDALRTRSPAVYAPVLLRGLRYPWPPAADHAAAALRRLPAEGTVPRLVELLDQPDPSVPALDPQTNRHTVSELVRLNHLENCLLCHAPSSGPDDGLVRGAMSTPGGPIVATSGGYYRSSSTGSFVRADITFLRQDFSVVLPIAVTTRGRGGDERFDFVTRVRTLPPREVPPGGPSGYPQREAVLYALRGLTGKDAGDSSRQWRELLFVTGEARPEVRDRAPAYPRP